MRITSLARLSNGHFVVAPLEERGQLALYDANGTFQRAIGRSGTGPGEFGTIRHVAAGSADMVHVFDETNARVTVLGRNLEHVRSTRALFYPTASLVVLSNGDYGIGPVSIPQTRDKAFSVVASASAAVRSTPTIRPDDTEWAHRILAPASNGGVWMARRNTYEIGLFDARGNLTLTMKGSSDWFKPWNASPARPDQVPSPSDIINIWEDTTANRLWVVARVAASDHRPTREPNLAARGAMARHLDLAVDVVDTRNQTIVVSARLPKQYLLAMHGQNMFYNWERDDDGFASLFPAWLELVPR